MHDLVLASSKTTVGVKTGPNPEGNTILKSLVLSRSPMKMFPLRDQTIRSDLQKVSHVLRGNSLLNICAQCSLSCFFLLSKTSFWWSEQSSAQTIKTFTFMHLADAFIQSDLHCIQVTVLHLISSCFPWERLHARVTKTDMNYVNI